MLATDLLAHLRLLPDDHPHAADLILAWNKIRALSAAPAPP
ncbi:hypothetical protein [Nonomuraea cavernae]